MVRQRGIQEILGGEWILGVLKTVPISIILPMAIGENVVEKTVIKKE